MLFKKKITNLFFNVKSTLFSIGSFLKTTFKDNYKNIFDTLKFIIIFGVLFNFPATVFFNFDFNVQTLISLGIIWYLLFFEMPLLFNRLRGSSNK